MDPSVVVSENLPHSPKSSKQLSSVIWYALITIAVLIGIIYLFRYINSRSAQKTQKAVVQQVSQIHKKRDIKGDLERQLKLTFSSTKYYEDINLYMNQASKSKTTAEAYANWLKAYSFVSKAYTDTKKVEIKGVLYEFRDFLKAFPMYKDSEVAIPK